MIVDLGESQPRESKLIRSTKIFAKCYPKLIVQDLRVCSCFPLHDAYLLSSITSGNEDLLPSCCNDRAWWTLETRDVILILKFSIISDVKTVKPRYKTQKFWFSHWAKVQHSEYLVNFVLTFWAIFKQIIRNYCTTLVGGC